MNKIYLIYNFTNIASHYRKNLWEKLILSQNFEFHFFYGSNQKLKIKEIDFSSEPFSKHKNKLHNIKNYWVFGRILIWQSKVISNCLKGEINTAIFLGEFQVISTWIAMLICKIRGIQVVYWTHGLYGNESYLKKTLRVVFYKTADRLLLYENRGKKLLIKEGVKEEKMEVIYNSLDYDTHLKIRNEQELKSSVFTAYFNNTNPVLIFIGRLTKQKKIELLLEAQLKLKSEGVNVNVIIVGEGDQSVFLENYAKENSLINNCWFYGACYNETKIAELLYNADLCVSPGNVGLTAIHSLSFGTPICTHNNFYNQMPEVEVIEEGFNGCFFEENNSDDLKDRILIWLNNSLARKKKREQCYNIIDNYYNPYYQIEVIKSIL